MHPLITERLRIGGITSWEIADLLGVHPHQLEHDTLGRRRSTDEDRLRALPVTVLIQLCRRLDLHPSDLIEELDEMCSSLRRAPREADSELPGEGEVVEDARTMVAALFHVGAPLSIEEAAGALGWGFSRARATVEHLQAHADLTGPYALRRVGADTYALTSRTDLLTAGQRTALESVVVAVGGTLPQTHVSVLEALLAGSILSGDDDAALADLLKLGLVSGSAEEGLELASEVLYSLNPGDDGGGSGDNGMSSPVTDNCRFQ
ncbi:SMC-Scp complex subunit ScpB [Nocardiopsis kunsanensis]|uniref:hypothetical protein n=1 Tax=Nocardiopsis kunsanensis TaxID=141693 RepID=UPI00034BF647|nr:hypothetical protein [Nocardiopsis kunsanensis]